MRDDLTRPHAFAAERIGFAFTRSSRSVDGRSTWILVTGYDPVLDDEYIDDPTVGARINSSAIRRVMQRVITTGEGAFHVHIHEHEGEPGLSYVDREELRPLMQSIRNASPTSDHGILLLSQDSARMEVLSPGTTSFKCASHISVIGYPMGLLCHEESRHHDEERFSRQSFLGEDSEERISTYRIGIVGLGGGGSHIAQQLAHIGFVHLALFDSDCVEASNLNRLVGATAADARKGTAKADIAARVIKGINPKAKIDVVKKRWQDDPDRLKACDLIFGCVDGFAERRDLEVVARRYLIPYVDIGLDVHQSGDEPPRMAGQIILSMPGGPCLTCIGFLTETKLIREAERYGVAGPRPQVVWANGILASTAVGVGIDLLTDWTRSLRGPVYLSYDSNTGEIQPHKRLAYLSSGPCPHFPFSQLGDPVFKPL